MSEFAAINALAGDTEPGTVDTDTVVMGIGLRALWLLGRVAAKVGAL